MDGSYGILLLTCLTRWNPCNGNRKLGAWKTLPQTYDSWYQKRFSSSKLLFLLLTWLGNQNHHLTLHQDNSNGFVIMVFKWGHAFRVNQDIIKNQHELSRACFLRHLHFFQTTNSIFAWIKSHCFQNRIWHFTGTYWLDGWYCYVLLNHHFGTNCLIHFFITYNYHIFACLCLGNVNNNNNKTFWN